MRVIATTIFLLLALPLLARARTLEELLAEKGVISKNEAASVTRGFQGDARSAPKVFWNDGTRVEFPENGFSVRIATFLQTRYSFTDAPEGQQNISDFDVNTARIDISGTALHDEFSYRFEYDGSDRHMKNVYLQWNPCEFGYARLGQFKTAVSRQFNSTDWKLMFADRSYASNFFSYGYQKGARAEARLLDGDVVAGASIYNGNSDGEGEYASGIDTKHLASADLRWDALGKMDPYEEGDINVTDDPALNLGAVYAYSAQNNKINGIDDKLGVNRVNVDASFKFKGFGANAEYYVSRESPDINDNVTTQGGYAQAGYFVLPKQLELALRWGLVDCDEGKGYGDCSGMDNVNQATAGINYYFWKHNLKAQLNYDYLRLKPTEGDVLHNNRWLFQLSSYF